MVGEIIHQLSCCTIFKEKRKQWIYQLVLELNLYRFYTHTHDSCMDYGEIHT